MRRRPPGSKPARCQGRPLSCRRLGPRHRASCMPSPPSHIGQRLFSLRRTATARCGGRRPQHWAASASTARRRLPCAFRSDVGGGRARTPPGRRRGSSQLLSRNGGAMPHRSQNRAHPETAFRRTLPPAQVQSMSLRCREFTPPFGHLGKPPVAPVATWGCSAGRDGGLQTRYLQDAGRSTRSWTSGSASDLGGPSGRLLRRTVPEGHRASLSGALRCPRIGASSCLERLCAGKRSHFGRSIAGGDGGPPSFRHGLCQGSAIFSEVPGFVVSFCLPGSMFSSKAM